MTFLNEKKKNCNSKERKLQKKLMREMIQEEKKQRKQQLALLRRVKSEEKKEERHRRAKERGLVLA